MQHDSFCKFVSNSVILSSFSELPLHFITFNNADVYTIVQVASVKTSVEYRTFIHIETPINIRYNFLAIIYFLLMLLLQLEQVLVYQENACG